ncbi:MAG: indole-3-glycerol phosphate synthase TrpC [Candidatus Eisenbacteria bacterium]|uniref:indole-3-glycerol-phosphate synthase n=1 Tax=Eiseniibacteriota bacterium TaxID=2212470 RepID=A0A849SL25_UNCEI|nr:indole-3-glycerol phosphate synthase TrpC [Candidatus Eisenbacteria bacterium]
MSGPGILEQIAAARRPRIERLKVERPPHELRARLSRTRPIGRLERALRRARPSDPLRMICEVKHTSPSRGVLDANVDPVARARAFELGGAAAISLVTEPDFFHGDLGWIDAVRPHVTIPLLLKDFVFDSYQLLDAAARGADGVLLIAAMLSEVSMQRLISDARLLGLDALVEVHDGGELNAALRAGATIVGINHRDLQTFEVDLSLSERLLPEIPGHVATVAESGISRPEDLARLRATRCDSVLMGEVFMTSLDPTATLATLAAAARGEGAGA